MTEPGKTGRTSRWRASDPVTRPLPDRTEKHQLRGGSGDRPKAHWQLGTGDAETVLAEARKALFVMVGFLAILWVVQIANWAGHYRLTAEYGIIPHDVARLPEIFTAPFLHFSWAHIEGNSGPLFIFGFLAAYRGVRKFLVVTLFVAITSGLAAWIFESPDSLGAGASGVVFGYFGYIMVRGIFDRHLIDLMIGLVMALCFAYQFTVLVPQAGIGWQAHIGGLAGGIAAGWLFRDRRPGRPRPRPGRPRPRPGRPRPRGGKTAGAGGKTPSRTESGDSRADLLKQIDELGL